MGSRRRSERDWCVLLVDDHADLRQAIREFLLSLVVVADVVEAEDGEAALAAVREREFDVVLMDVHLPGLDGPGATRKIAQESADTPVLAISLDSSRRAVEAMALAGARGFLLKENIEDELDAALATVVRGGRYWGRGMCPSAQAPAKGGE